MKKLGLALLVVCVGCTESHDNKDAPAASAPAPSSASAASSAAPSKPMVKETITSSSPEAIAAFLKGRDLVDNEHEVEAVDQFKKAVDLDPKFPLARAYLGYYTPSMDGVHDLDVAASQADTLPKPEQLAIAELQALRQGNTAKALADAKKAVELAPFDWHAQLDLGNRYYAERKLDEAAEAFKKAAAFGPASYAVYNALGYTYLLQHKPAEAAATFRRYVNLKPDEANALDSLGEALMNDGKLDEAEATFVKAADMKFPYAWDGVAYTKFLRGDRAGGAAALAKSRAGTPWPSEKLDVDVIGIWAAMARPTDVLPMIDAFEKAATAQKSTEHQTLAPVLRGVAYIEANKYLDALRETGEGQKRVEKMPLPGVAAERVRRAALRWHLIAEAKLHKPDQATKTAALLEDELKRDPTDPDVKGLDSFGRGMVAIAKNDPKAAVAELSGCSDEDYICGLERVEAEKAVVDPKMATDRDGLLGQNLRRPSYLYVHEKLSQLK